MFFYAFCTLLLHYCKHKQNFKVDKRHIKIYNSCVERERNLGIDILKFVCAFLVCAVHFSPSPYLRAIARVAVPVFFLLSGYFTENSCKQDAHKIGKKNLKFFIKTVIVLAIFVSLHFLFLTLTKDLTGGGKEGLFVSALVSCRPCGCQPHLLSCRKV